MRLRTVLTSALVILAPAIFIAASAEKPDAQPAEEDNAELEQPLAFQLKSEVLSQAPEIAAAIKVVQAAPEDTEAWAALAEALAERAAFPDAIRALRQATKLAPEDAGLWNDTGAVYIRSGDSSKGVSALKRALKIDPFLAVGYHNLGIAYQNLNEYDAMFESFERAILLDPRLGDPKTNPAVIANRDMALVKLSMFAKTGGEAPAMFTSKQPAENAAAANGGAGDAR